MHICLVEVSLEKCLFLYQLSLRGLGVLNFQAEYLIGEKNWLNNGNF